jgi:carotenoid cleavage dioxygenase-like enzyme
MNPPATRTPPPNRAPIDFETDLGPLPLQGTLPAGLRGTLVRNGPNPLVPDEHTHFFGGDGMLHAFHIEDGQVRYRNRWIRTARLDYARRTGRTYSTGEVGRRSEESLPHDDGTGNTHVIRHAGRVLALEEAHLPIGIELATLATLGTDDFAGGLHHKFTAHPKTDPRTGELLFFGYGTPEPLSNGMSFGVISSEGRVTRLEQFAAPYAAMVHDFAVTDRYVLFPIMPLTASRERAQAGRPPFAWEPEYGTRVGIMPRAKTTGDIEWWSGPACYVFHVMNAWESGDQLFVDVMQFNTPPLFPRPDGSLAAGPGEPGKLVRWRFDLAGSSREFTQTVLEEIPGEFPRIDDRRAGLAYRHGWYAGSTPGADGQVRMQSSVVHIDHAAPRADVYTFDARDRVSEPVFVARSADAAEGDGWVLTTVWRSATNTSDMVVFDARRVAAGPVCVASLPHRVPDGFHGNWFAAGEVPGAQA